MAVALTIPPKAARKRALFGASNVPDSLFRGAVFILGALLLLVIIAVIVGSMVRQSGLSMSTFGWSFVTSATWDPVHRVFGALPFIYGTLVSSLIGLLIATPISLGVAIFVVELAPPWLGNTISLIVELLAAVP